MSMAQYKTAVSPDNAVLYWADHVLCLGFHLDSF